jgi:hypothetical protein
MVGLLGELAGTEVTRNAHKFWSECLKGTDHLGVKQKGAQAILKKTGNVGKKVTLRRVRVTTVAVKKQ